MVYGYCVEWVMIKSKTAEGRKREGREGKGRKEKEKRHRSDSSCRLDKV